MARSFLQAQMAARSLISHYGIDRVEEIVVEDIAFAQGLRIRIDRIAGADGRLVRDAKNGFATVNQAIKNQKRRRFIMAHEFGHYELHQNVRLITCDAAAFLDWSGVRLIETEANYFAAELLMPTPLFRRESDRQHCSLNTLRDLSDSFNVSLSACAIRYAHLDINPCVIVFSQHRKVVWKVMSDSFKYKYLMTGKRVHAHSGAGEFFQKGSVSESAEVTPCSAWFTDFELNPNDTCLEQCLPMPSLNAVLSLISM